jgi:hypothetical protein
VLREFFTGGRLSASIGDISVLDKVLRAVEPEAAE